MANEKRLDLIDRSELLPNGVFYVNGDNPMSSLNELLNRIANAKTVDAVEVVRCKDCKHYDFGVCLKIYSDGAVSQYAWQARNEDDFCSYGERKDNGSTQV